MTGISYLGGLLRRSLSDPSAATEELLSHRVPQGILPVIVATVIVVSVLLGVVMGIMVGIGPAYPVMGYAISPFLAVFLHALNVIVTAYAIFAVGRMFGGTGALSEAFIVVSWVQAIQIVLQAIQIVLLMILPPVAMLLALVAIPLTLYILTHGVAVLHGFRSRLSVFLMLLVGAFALAVIALFALQIFGFNFDLPEGTT